MRIHNIVELVIIIGCLFILISEYKPHNKTHSNDKIIHNTLKYNEYKMMNDEAASKTTKDSRYIEAY